MNIAVSEFDDYPPRIFLDLSPSDETSAPAELKLMGLKKECSFIIANERKLQSAGMKSCLLSLLPQVCRMWILIN